MLTYSCELSVKDFASYTLFQWWWTLLWGDKMFYDEQRFAAVQRLCSWHSNLVLRCGDNPPITAATSCLRKHSTPLNRNLVPSDIRFNQDHTWGVTPRRAIWLDELSLFCLLLMSLRGLMLLPVTWASNLTHVNLSLPPRKGCHIYLLCFNAHLV